MSNFNGFDDSITNKIMVGFSIGLFLFLMYLADLDNPIYFAIALIVLLVCSQPIAYLLYVLISKLERNNTSLIPVSVYNIGEDGMSEPYYSITLHTLNDELLEDVKDFVSGLKDIQSDSDDKMLYTIDMRHQLPYFIDEVTRSIDKQIDGIVELKSVANRPNFVAIDIYTNVPYTLARFVKLLEEGLIEDDEFSILHYYVAQVGNDDYEIHYDVVNVVNGSLWLNDVPHDQFENYIAAVKHLEVMD